MFRCNKKFDGRFINQFLKSIPIEPYTAYEFTFDHLGGAVGAWVNHCFAVPEESAYYFDRCREWATHTIRFTTTGRLDKQAAFENWGLAFYKKMHSLYITGLEDSYIDNVRLVKVDAPSVNLIVGGDFEAPCDAPVYNSHWRPMFLGEQGEKFHIRLVNDPLNSDNHCLLLPKLIAPPVYPPSVVVRSGAFGYYKELTSTDVRHRDSLGMPEHLLLLAERGELIVNGETSLTVPAGGGLFLPHGTPSHILLRRGKNTAYYWIYFSGDDIDELLPDFGINGLTAFTPRDMSLLTGAIDRMLQFPADNPFYPYAVSGYLQVILAELSRRAEVEPPNDHELLLRHIAESLREQPELPVNNTELAKNCGFSVGHFIRLFKQHLGCTPHQYHLQAVIQKACAMLRDTTLSVKEIAFRLGFDNPLYFSNMFRRLRGISPTEYRRKGL